VLGDQGKAGYSFRGFVMAVISKPVQTHDVKQNSTLPGILPSDWCRYRAFLGFSAAWEPCFFALKPRLDPFFFGEEDRRQAESARWICSKNSSRAAACRESNWPRLGDPCGSCRGRRCDLRNNPAASSTNVTIPSIVLRLMRSSANGPVVRGGRGRLPRAAGLVPGFPVSPPRSPEGPDGASGGAWIWDVSGLLIGTGKGGAIAGFRSREPVDAKSIIR
jgi:hypothetical protein